MTSGILLFLLQNDEHDGSNSKNGFRVSLVVALNVITPHI